MKIICDRGKEFLAEVKELIKLEYGIQLSTIMVHNPQANSILERIHQTIVNLICTFKLHSSEIGKKRSVEWNSSSSNVCD